MLAAFLVNICSGCFYFYKLFTMKPKVVEINRLDKSDPCIEITIPNNGLQINMNHNFTNEADIIPILESFIRCIKERESVIEQVRDILDEPPFQS